MTLRSIQVIGLQSCIIYSSLEYEIRHKLNLLNRWLVSATTIGQVVHALIPLSLSSIIHCWPNGSHPLSLGRWPSGKE